MSDEVVDGEVVEDGPDHIGAQPQTVASLELVPVAHGALTAPVADVTAVRDAFEQYDQLRRTIVVKSDVTAIAGKEFVNKSGWRKLAVVMGVSGEIRSREYVRDAQGRIASAEVVVRAVAPNGRFMDGLGACDAHERCCPKAYDENAVCRDGRRSHHHCPVGCDGYNHFSKPQHDIPATASTRALNRACSDLFGFGEVSAEEVTERDDPADKADINALVHALNTVAADQRAHAKHAFVERFGMPAELKKGQVDAAVRFVRALGVEVAPVDAPAAAAKPEPTSSQPETAPAASDEPAVPGAPSESSGAENGGAADGMVVGSSSSQAPPAAPPRPSTAQQRRTIGMAFRSLIDNEVVLEGDKAEIVGMLTLGRTTTTTEITFDEAVKLVALVHYLESGTVKVWDDDDGTRVLAADHQPGIGFLGTLPMNVVQRGELAVAR